TRSHAHGGAHHIVLGTQAGEREPGSPTRLVHQRHGPQRVVDAALAVRERVFHREHEARRELTEGPPGVHERGRIRHPDPRGHELEERLRQALHGLVGGPVASIRLGDGARDAPEQVLGPLGRLPLVVLHQVAALEHGHGVGAQIECAGATGSSHAGSSLAEVSLLTKRVACVNLLRADQKGAEGQGRPTSEPGGMRAPSGTTAPAATTLPVPMWTPLSSTLPMPIRQSSSTVQPCRMARCPTPTRAPIRAGSRSSTCTIVPSWRLVFSPTTIAAMSPRSTALYH